MFIHSREIESSEIRESDICIIGGGAAGITIAREFLSSQLSVAVIVGGGMQPESNTQELSDGEAVDQRYFPPITIAVRCLGGNTTHWGSWCRPFTELDFQERPWVPYSGWPLTAADMTPYYEKAHDLLKLGRHTYDPDLAALELGDPAYSPVDLTVPELETKVWRFHKPPVCFGRDHQDELSSSRNISVYLDAHVLDINLSEDGSLVTSISTSTLEGKRITFRARRYVLAAGGIQNPRILLANTAVHKNGIGNEYDVVGRYFMDHPHLHANGLVVLNDISLYPNLYDTNSQYSKMLVAGYCPTDEYQRSAQIMNCAVNFKPSHRVITVSGASRDVGEGATTLWDDIANFPGKAYRRLRKAFGYKNTYAPERPFLDVITRSEQSPNPLSRVTLTSDRDALGMQKVRIDWRVTGLERRTIYETHRRFAEGIGAASLGRVKLEISESTLEDGVEWNTTGENGRFEGGWHQMGATRMSSDPRYGVVDANCRVHGMSNLFIAGASVFPTSSAFNPTMTVVALAFRLADHLKRTTS